MGFQAWVREFLNRHDLSYTPQTHALDLTSEVGEGATWKRPCLPCWKNTGFGWLSKANPGHETQESRRNRITRAVLPGSLAFAVSLVPPSHHDPTV
jgi:hypothetical protein